jgi:hypothetical protein
MTSYNIKIGGDFGIPVFDYSQHSLNFLLYLLSSAGRYVRDKIPQSTIGLLFEMWSM